MIYNDWRICRGTLSSYSQYVTGTSFSPSLTAGDTYAFSVQAEDDFGDASAVSQVVVVTILQPKVINPSPVPGG
jgi:hypothetical protein